MIVFRRYSPDPRRSRIHWNRHYLYVLPLTKPAFYTHDRQATQGVDEGNVAPEIAPATAIAPPAEPEAPTAYPQTVANQITEEDEELSPAQQQVPVPQAGKLHPNIESEKNLTIALQKLRRKQPNPSPRMPTQMRRSLQRRLSRQRYSQRSPWAS